MRKLLIRPLLLLIKAYQFLVSPLLGCRCRFHPSCSEYTAQAISCYGLRVGLYLSVRRLLKCHPWHPGGLDPVPPNNHKLSSTN